MNVLDMLRAVADGGITVARAAIHLGRVTIQVVIKVVFTR